MRPIPVPDGWIDRHLPGAQTRVVAPPDGDLTNTEIAPVEVIVGGFESGSTISALCRLEDDDLDRLHAGGYVLLTFWARHLHPFGVQVVDP